VTKILKATSGRLFGRVTSGAGRAEELTPTQVRTLIEFDESVDDRVSALLAAGTNITITYNDAPNTLTIASTAGGLSGTGSVDNAALRADGTGGSTLQSSSIVIDDLFTASPNNTVNFTCLKPTGGTTNVGIAIVPKGTGALTLAVPDGTSTGGNARGASSIDLSLLRSAAVQVASGSRAVLVGSYCTASGNFSVAVGDSNSAAGDNTTAVGSSNTASSTGCAVGSSNTASGGSDTAVGRMNLASGSGSFAGGLANIASGAYSVAVGAYSSATQTSQRARAAVFFAAQGDSQEVGFIARRVTTDSTPTTLSLSHVNATLTRLSIAPGKAFLFDVRVIGIKSDGSAAACYHRKVAIKNVGGTTSLIGTVQTVGTDIEDNAATDVAIDRDDANDALQISVTGITGETWRWLAIVDGLELAYGT